MQKMHNGKPCGISGAILAGGINNRMGQDKASIQINGSSLIDKAEAVLRNLCDDVFIAGNRPDLQKEGRPIFGDSFPNCSLTGLHNAIRNAKNNWVCVLPCDLPYTSGKFLESLLSHCSDVQAVVPRIESRVEPLIACYHKDCLPVIENRLQSGQNQVLDLLAVLKTRFIETESLPPGWRRAVLNINSQQDLDRVLSPPPAVTFVARSGTGKTTLVEKLIHALVSRGWTIGALKHDAHQFEIDHEGKDSWRMTQAGASVMTITSAHQSATVRKHDRQPSLHHMILRDFQEVDLVLTEGFKGSRLPKIEVHRHALEQPLLCRGQTHDPNLVAIVSDTQLQLDVPIFDLNEPHELILFLEREFLG
jgi:molybdopterin-guanine dinucleotide biosynthesis protein B/molybdopterin-guanine dinucleotide biosynthesis protein